LVHGTAAAKKQGKLIVFEGLSDSILQAAADSLQTRLKARGISAFVTQQPSRGPLGNQIRLITQGYLKVLDAGALAVYLAADCCDNMNHEHGILPRIEQGETVLCCRYVLSSYAYYDFAHKGISIEWLRTVNAPLRRPDLTVYIDSPAQGALHKRIAKQYDLLIRALEAEGERFLRIDGAAAADAMTSQIDQAVEALYVS
jgi:dTMP kinase